MLSASELARYFDHTLLSPTATESQIAKLCEEAIEYNFFSVCVHPYWLNFCQDLLSKSHIQLCTVIGFPLGQNTTKSKVFETQNALESGADEFDMVINLAALKNKNWKYIKQEISDIAKATQGKYLKVIIETAYLTPSEIEQATHACEDSGAQFVKTSTGFASRGASFEDIQQIAKARKSSVKIKASGGIKDLSTALKFIELGAERLGSSKSVDILKSYTDGVYR